MFLAALLLLSPTGVGDEAMESLLRQLRSDDPDVRSGATAGILSAWPRWKNADLMALEEAAADPDPEVGGRAAEVRARIRIRRILGQNLFSRIDRVDDAFLRGDDFAKLTALQEARSLWKSGSLGQQDLEGLQRLATRAVWTDPSSLDQFLSEPDSKLTFSLSGDAESRARIRVKEVELLGAEGRNRSGQVAEYLSDGAPEVRETAIRVIGGIQARERAPQIAALLRDRHAGVRADALELLRTWGAKEYADDFARLLEDPNGAVRRRAMEALYDFGLKDAGPRIAKLLKDPFAPSRAEAALALGSLGAREFTNDLVPLLADPKAQVRGSAVYALGRFGAVECAPQLKGLLGDPDPMVRMSAAQSLGQLGSEFQSDEIVGLLRDADSEVGVEAAWVLGFMASPIAMKEIALLLENPDTRVRRHAVWTLGLLKAREFRAVVSERLQDSGAWVRSEAVLALGRIGRQEDALLLAAMLRDPDRKVRVNAALALGELGAGDPGGILASLERDQDRLLGLASNLSLARLGKGSPATLRAALQEISADDLAFGYLGAVASDVASFLHSREAWNILERPLKLQRSVETWKDLSSVLSDAGLLLEIQTDATIGRLDKSRVLSGRDALAWLFGRFWTPSAVLDGRKVRIMNSRESLLYWQNRLADK
ncbi:MAG TPA: HEAT repeat domain-containing protein [Planctomycetota bacterium]|nr:HEAT repeat domain-containing protein [Planctomycetota bacterium]